MGKRNFGKNIHAVFESKGVDGIRGTDRADRPMNGHRAADDEGVKVLVKSRNDDSLCENKLKSHKEINAGSESKMIVKEPGKGAEDPH